MEKLIIGSVSAIIGFLIIKKLENNKKITENADNNYKTFTTWLDNIFQKELPKTVKAIHFNLYEDGNNKWSIELIGASHFDETDSDWACNEVYTTRETPYMITKKDSWQNIEKIFSDKIKEYLNNGKYSDKLKKFEAVGIGFVDGDITILFKKSNNIYNNSEN